MKPQWTDLLPFVLIPVLTLIAFVTFWSVMDMVLVGASIAVVLLPLHHRIKKYARPRISAAIVTLSVCLALLIAVSATQFVLSANATTLKDLLGYWRARGRLASMDLSRQHRLTIDCRQLAADIPWPAGKMGRSALSIGHGLSGAAHSPF